MQEIFVDLMSNQKNKRRRKEGRKVGRKERRKEENPTGKIKFKLESVRGSVSKLFTNSTRQCFTSINPAS